VAPDALEELLGIRNTSTGVHHHHRYHHAPDHALRAGDERIPPQYVKRASSFLAACSR
jgi:hypothetical protein